MWFINTIPIADYARMKFVKITRDYKYDWNIYIYIYIYYCLFTTIEFV